jgi:hypothetical protein
LQIKALGKRHKTQGARKKKDTRHKAQGARKKKGTRHKEEQKIQG